MHEWPLLIFTLLVQASVGLTLFTAVNAFNRQANSQPLRVALVASCVMGGVGLIASVAHLGYPLNAFNSLRHVASSWLSREIVFAALYLGVLGITTLLALFAKRVVPLLVLLAGLIGLVDVYCMSNIFISASVITWMHINTFFMFYGSVLILGAVLAMLMLVPHGRNGEMRDLAKLAVAAVVVAVAARLVEQPAYMSFLAQAHTSDVVMFPLQALATFDALAGVRIAAWCLMVVGAALFALSLRQPRIARGIAMTGSVLLVVAEIMARYAFFSLS
ncbi:dimethyl sulfoxide reductase anchor subunit family protein [Atlantibacter subterraneus]|uniref:dimethyl sulfoxide reductase anchor subunit family protein n=1 Tax=Atlantibacter subterraneus TaxID=255519 RepID=UPI0022EB5397|nr:DmsC/YnfH family molybdoenzyme membrane anchor subunit [Atlantibacter subterranea]MDA3133298.1 dimethyl sulfoxide reductase anchor subunit [Atlantibacter subterranea]